MKLIGRIKEQWFTFALHEVECSEVSYIELF